MGFPATAPEGPNETGVPDTVMMLPDASVCEPMINIDAKFIVYISPPNVSSLVAEGLIEMVELPMIAEEPPGARDTGVPEMVMTAPGTRFRRPEMASSLEFAVNGWLPGVRIVGFDCAAALGIPFVPIGEIRL